MLLPISSICYWCVSIFCSIFLTKFIPVKYFLSQVFLFLEKSKAVTVEQIQQSLIYVLLEEKTKHHREWQAFDS